MRITNSMLVSNLLNNLNGNMSRLEKLQNQMASGKKYVHVSDDPVSVIYSQQANRRMNRLDIYKTNVEISSNWLTAAEGGVMELNEILKNAYEALIDGATDVKGESDKNNVSQYVAQLRDQVVQSLNTAFGTKYVFGGYDTPGYTDAGGNLSPPFTVNTAGNLCFNGIDLTAIDDTTRKALQEDVLTFDIGVGIDMQVTLNGVDVAIFDAGGTPPTNNVYNLLDELYKKLESGAGADEISAYLPQLQDAQEYLLGRAAGIGGKQNRLELIKSRYEQDEINYIQMLSDAEDADEAEVIMNYKMAEAAYNAALAAGASIIQPTLMDFLR